MAQVGAADQELDDFAAQLVKKVEILKKNNELALDFENKAAYAIDQQLKDVIRIDKEVDNESKTYTTAQSAAQKPM